MSHGLVIAVRCHYCSRSYPPHQILNLGRGGATMCHRCYEWHGKALEMLAGNPPPGCQECEVAFSDLEKRAHGGNVRMYVHAKDGVYQVLCRTCSDAYEQKRADLYSATAYGRQKQIDGSK